MSGLAVAIAMAVFATSLLYLLAFIIFALDCQAFYQAYWDAHVLN